MRSTVARGRGRGRGGAGQGRWHHRGTSCMKLDGGSRQQLPVPYIVFGSHASAHFASLLLPQVVLLPPKPGCSTGFRCFPSPLTPALLLPPVQVLADELRDACQRARVVAGGGAGPGAPPPGAAGRGARQPVHVGFFTWG